MEPLSLVNFRFVLFVAPAFFRRFALAVIVFVSVAVADFGHAQDRRQGEPGQFDYYVLALSWSPSFCEASESRSRSRAADRQCTGRAFAFVVHGLWPQYERGFPSNCQVPAPRLNRAIVADMLDLMPSPHLIYHEWDRHGTCSGLTATNYFDLIRRARTAIKIPSDFSALEGPASVSPGDIVSAFLNANPTLPRDAISVACDARRLTEVRFCLAKDLSFRGCPDIARHGCRRDNISMPALRGR